MLRSKIKLFVLLFCSLLMLSSCLPDTTVDMETPYNNYILYDPHLQCQNIKDDKIESARNTDVFYHEIWHVPEENLMCVDYGTGLFDDHERYVVQNPDGYEDIFHDWTIKSVGVYKENSVRYSATPNRELLGELSQDAINELKTFYSAEKQNGIPFFGYGPDYTWEGECCESLAVFCIRVNYEESKNVYWEMEVRSFFEQEAPDERILSAEWLTVGEAEQIDAFFASLSEYPALCDEVSEIIGTFLTEHPLINKNTSTEK